MIARTRETNFARQFSSVNLVHRMETKIARQFFESRCFIFAVQQNLPDALTKHPRGNCSQFAEDGKWKSRQYRIVDIPNNVQLIQAIHIVIAFACVSGLPSSRRAVPSSARDEESAAKLIEQRRLQAERLSGQLGDGKANLWERGVNSPFQPCLR